MTLYKLVDGETVEMTPQEEAAFEAAREGLDAPSKAALRARAEAVRDAKLAEGFDHDFGPEDPRARGVHRFGYTDADREGWREVKGIADAAMQAGVPALAIDIRTNTGNTTIEAQEWPAILLAGAQALQPIWQASWTVKDDIDSGAVTDFAGVEAHAAWPG